MWCLTSRKSLEVLATTVSVGDPAAKRQLPFGLSDHRRHPEYVKHSVTPCVNKRNFNYIYAYIYIYIQIYIYES